MGRVKNEAQIFVSEHVRGTEGDVWGRKLEFEVSCGTKCRDPSRGVDRKGESTDIRRESLGRPVVLGGYFENHRVRKYQES